MSRLSYAPTLALPFIEVEAVTGPGTNYPFGRFDLGTVDGAQKFDLFAALAARVTVWDITGTVHYRRRRDFTFIPPDFDDVTGTHTGTFQSTARMLSVGANEVVIGDVESNDNGPSDLAWVNPHGAAFGADPTLISPPYLEEHLIIPGVRLVASAGGTSASTDTGDLETEDGPNPGFYDCNIAGNCLYNQTLAREVESGFGPFYAHSFRSRRYGYVAFQFLGALGFYERPSGVAVGGGLGASFSTHKPTLQATPGAATYGECGTFTLQWPHAITGATLSVACPVYGAPAPAGGVETVLTMSADYTMTPATALEYGGTYDPATGAPRRCPLN